jgi:hypothetical protein
MNPHWIAISEITLVASVKRPGAVLTWIEKRVLEIMRVEPETTVSTGAIARAKPIVRG